ncbi:acyl-CoA hydrolase [Deinobacterium chartae]|uniref:Acyl-CoA hydrolase n=1 Tax=Deinobacterium chartae TaxID=521158 RepID=A0A841I7S2_9DEIO|nr:acyl-CoA thioesterase [Deinobacterium chartae]MBB6099855.1 acyl-CoA hydrolase [Deinobacterium chartae]
METRIVHAVFPGMTNHYHTLFGGEALAWMDSAAFIAATRHCHARVVTAHTDPIDFRRPVPQGTLAELIARVVETGRSRIVVEVELWTEQMYSDARELACRGRFVMVAVDEQGRPIPVPPLSAQVPA